MSSNAIVTVSARGRHYDIDFDKPLASFSRIPSRLSINSARTGNNNEPKGRRKIINTGTYRDKCIKCVLISLMSSAVHLFPVFLCFIRSFMKFCIPLLSRRMRDLFFAMVLLRNVFSKMFCLLMIVKE